MSIQKNYDNSVRGLPYKPRKIVKQDVDSFKARHTWVNPPSLDNVEMIWVCVDTMDEFFSVGVFALDTNDSISVIHAEEVQWLFLDEVQREAVDSERKQAGKPPAVTVEDLLKKQWLCNNEGVGIIPTFLVIDAGGHRADEVKYFAKQHSNVVMWRGGSMQADLWKTSENFSRLVIGNEKHFRELLIYHLYSQTDREQNYFFISPSVTEDIIAQITCVKPDPSSKWGDQPKNWRAPNDKDDHFFDVCKMAYFAKAFAIASFKRVRWRFGQALSIRRRWEKQAAKQAEVHQKEAREHNWFTI